MAQSTRMDVALQKVAATKGRNFRTFLLMARLEAKEIGARIAHARELRGLTQPELAEMAAFSTRSLQDYEAGVTIPYRHMRDLSRLLKKPEEWFLYGEKEEGDTPDVAARLILLEGQLAALTQMVEVVLTELRSLHLEPDGAPAPRTEAPRRGAVAS